MEKIIKDLQDIIISELKDNENLISFTVVGSFADFNKKLEKFNDFDLVFVLKKTSAEALKELENLAKAIQRKFSTESIGITYTFKIGPIKIASNKPITIMLHFLVYSKKGYTIYESNCTRSSFQHCKPLLGKSLKNIDNIEKITSEDLFNDIDGIPAMRKWIKTRVGGYIEPTAAGAKFTPVKLNAKQYLEILFYSVLRLASNMVRLKENYLAVNTKMCRKFKNLYPIKLSDLPESVLNLKQKLRKGKEFSDDELTNLKNLALDFINQCEDILKLP